MARDALLAKIHIAKKDMNMETDDYRSFLQLIVGQDSAKGLTVDQKKEVVQAFIGKGWKPNRKKKGATQRFIPEADDARARLIFALWGELGELGALKSTSRTSLFAFCKRMTKERHPPEGISNPNWLTKNVDFDSIIIPLKRMIERKEMESLK